MTRSPIGQQRSATARRQDASPQSGAIPSLRSLGIRSTSPLLLVHAKSGTIIDANRQAVAASGVSLRALRRSTLGAFTTVLRQRTAGINAEPQIRELPSGAPEENSCVCFSTVQLRGTEPRVDLIMFNAPAGTQASLSPRTVQPPHPHRENGGGAVFPNSSVSRDHTSILDAMVDGYYRVDGTGRFLQANESYSAMIGYGVDELLTMSIADVEALESPSEVRQHIAHVMATGKDRFTTLQRHRDGSTRCLQISVLLSNNRTNLHSFVRDDTARTAAERALRSSEVKFATAFRLAPDILSISTLHEARFIDVNEAYERASGYTREQSIGKTVFELGLWARPEERTRMYETLIAKGKVREMPVAFRTGHGVVREGRLSAERVEIEGTDCIVSVIQDVTEKEELQRSLQFQSKVLETIGQSVIACDQSGVITYWNRAATALFGLAPEQALGRTGHNLYGPDLNDPEPMRIVQETLQHGSWSGTLVLKRPDGSPLPILLNTSVLSPGAKNDASVIAIVTDLSDVRRQEEVLRESEKWYRELFERSFDPICAATMTGIIRDVNPAACELLGISRDRLIGADVKTIIGAQWQGFMAVVEANLKNGEGTFDWTYPAPSGGEATYEISVRHFQLKGEDAVLAVGRNISRRREMEKHLKSTIAEKEVLLQETHHRVKNNLQIIASLLNLRKSGIKDPVAVSLIDQSRHRIELMASVYERVYQSKNLAQIDFADFLRRSVRELVESMCPEHVSIDIRFAMTEIKLDLQHAIYMGIVVHELVSNAVKHAFAGREHGTIDVILERPQTGALTLIVADDGVGLPEDVDAETTLSLGLRLVNVLTKQLGGSATAHVAGGTRWTVSIAVCPT